MFVSLADKTHNAEAMLFDFLGEARWSRFTGGAFFYFDGPMLRALVLAEKTGSVTKPGASTQL
jgi:hypothetical protein